MFGQNRKRLQTFVQPSDDDQRREDTSEDLTLLGKNSIFYREKVFSHEFSENGKNKAKTNFQRIKINLGHVLTNVRTI